MPPALVQVASNTGTSTVTVTLGAATTAGNCLVACIALGGGNTLASVSGITLGAGADHWALLPGAAAGSLNGGAEQLAVWADPNCAGGQTAVTITAANATVTLAYVFEFSGLATASILDQLGTADSGGVSSGPAFSVSTGGATSQSSELAVACTYGYNQTITGPGPSWVNEATLTSTTRNLQASYKILSAAGAVTYSGTYGASTFSGQIVVTLKTPGPSVATTALANVVQGVKVRRWLSVTGGTAPYTWSVTAGSLPAGLTLASDGTLSGTPSATGASTFTAQVTDATAATAAASLSITSVSAPLTPSGPTTDANGVITWNVTSAINGNNAETIRVLNPVSPGGYPHGFLFTMPVETGTDSTTYGNGLDTVRTLGLHNTYNLTVVEASFQRFPWYADNPSDGTCLEETYMLQVVAWAAAQYGTGREKNYLIGFSKSGIGGQGLFFHWPGTFYGVASWDFPAMMTGYDGTDPDHGTVGDSPSAVYGTQDNFAANYELTAGNLAKWAAGQNFGSVNRVWIGDFFSFQADVSPYDPVLTAAGIRHTYSHVSESVHAWNPAPGWVATALAAIIAPPGSGLLMAGFP